jgi:signal peptidase I
MLRQVLVTILCGAVFAILLQITVQNYVVEGTSMLPNVHSGDRVLVDRLAYHVGSPRRGDIVVFRFPWSSSNLIKRVIGLPGDTVQITPAVVRVNGRVVREPYIRYVEQYTYGPARVPAGDYFVLGDNRVVSYDSHIWGFLPRNYLYGRVMVTYWPMSDFHLYGL